MENVQKYRAVRFDEYGGPEVLHLSELEIPAPGKGQVLVKVKAAGINMGETAEREGAFAKIWPWPLPSGQGTDFAGIVENVGEGVSAFKKGDEAIGFTQKRDSQAEYVLAEADCLVPKPSHVSWEQGGALFMVGTTAYGAVRAVSLQKGDTLIDFDAANKYKVKSDGSDVVATGEVLAELVNDVDQGKLELPIARTYPLTEVREAFRELEKRHTHGKIVLVP